MSFPKTYRPSDAPREVILLVDRLMPILLEGDHPTLQVLRDQYRSSQIESVELTGVGFFANFKVREDDPRITPPDLVGGDALIEIEGAPNGAGCVLFVRGGRLSCLDVYTYAVDEGWSENTKVLAVKDVVPIRPRTNMR